MRDALDPFYRSPSGGVALRSPHPIEVRRVVDGHPAPEPEPRAPFDAVAHDRATILARVYLELSVTEGSGWGTVRRAFAVTGFLDDTVLAALAALGA